MKINNRWFQLCASLIAMIMIANLQYAWTLFVKPMRTATGWKLSDIQWAFTLFILFQTWVQPAQGLLIDRHGTAAVHDASPACCAASAGPGSATSTTLPMLYTLYVIAGIGAALVYGGCIGSALKWFTNKRGFAAGHHGGRVRRRHGAVHSVHRRRSSRAAATRRRSSTPAFFKGS